MKEKRKIVVAMSGGVDSSTVAALLHDQGHEVIGVTLNLCKYNTDTDAKQVAKDLGIKHYSLELKKDFHNTVISDFMNTYVAGETPNPCLTCNKKMKFGVLYDFAKKLGADSLATGHYVRKCTNGNEAELHKAIDISKDQSYFLFVISKEKLAFLEFPLGEYKKPEVRELARKYNLVVAEKAESKDVCFIPNGNRAALIKQHCEDSPPPGNFVDTQGNVLGKHDGIINYTVGQRRGLGITGDKPVYVVKIDVENNAVVVGSEEELENREFYIRNTNWFVDPESIKDKEVDIKIRSMHTGDKATISFDGDKSLYKVTPASYCKAIAPGQACVIYSDTHMLGGGFICSDAAR
jgi:tRNA-specific 2-thiouridylase